MKTVHLRPLTTAAAALEYLAGSVAAQDKPTGVLKNAEVRQLVARAEPADHVRLNAHSSAAVHHDRLAGLARDATKEAMAAAEMHRGLAGVARS